MMHYISTRGGMAPQPFSAILVEGLATDGGLAVPERYPRFSAAEFAALRSLNYRDLALAIRRLVGTNVGCTRSSIPCFARRAMPSNLIR